LISNIITLQKSNQRKNSKQSIFGNSYSSYNYRRAPFGGFSGSRGLAVGAGAGFIGGAVAGIAAVSMFHQYRQYQRMMYCIGNPLCYGGKASIRKVNF